MPEGFNYSLRVIFPSGKEKYLENLIHGKSISVKESGFAAHHWFLFVKSLDRIIKSISLTTEFTKLLLLILIFYFILLYAEKNKFNFIVKKSVWILLLIIFYLILFYNFYDLPLINSLMLTFLPPLFIGIGFLFISHKIIEKKKSQYISHFKLIDVLGMGGMGKVYKALDINTNTIVAVKVLNPELMKSDENRRRISDEGRILTGLNHPNIVKVIEVGETENNSFVAMEYLPGGTLEAYIKKHFPLSFEKIRNFMIQICSGLDEIHQKKIIHRDLKTANIMLDPDGNLRIMDFGLSKSPLISTMTSLGTALGTLGYVAPEQITNSSVDNRTDIFSVGIILYEMITNDLPFKGENEIAMIHSIFNIHPPNPCELNNLIPNFVGEIVLKCINKEINNRYNSVTEIISAINEGS
jgi:serine/threonine protein kinase